MNWGEWHRHCDVMLGYYWRSEVTSEAGSPACLLYCHLFSVSLRAGWFICFLSGIHPVRYDDISMPYLFTVLTVCVFRRKKARCDPLLCRPLRSGFPSRVSVCRGCWDWLVGCTELPLSDSGARKLRRSLIWLVAAFSKYEFGCSTVSPLRKEREEKPITL